MEEKFYYTRNYILRCLLGHVAAIGLFAIFILYPQPFMLRDYIFWAIADRIAVIAVVFSGVRFFKKKNDPIVITGDRGITLRSQLFRKCEIGFEKIISATLTTGILRDKDNERIKIRFRKPNNEESIASIYIGGIGDSERLVELLKQRIKFV